MIGSTNKSTDSYLPDTRIQGKISIVDLELERIKENIGHAERALQNNNQPARTAALSLGAQAYSHFVEPLLILQRGVSDGSVPQTYHSTIAELGRKHEVLKTRLTSSGIPFQETLERLTREYSTTEAQVA